MVVPYSNDAPDNILADGEPQLDLLVQGILLVVADQFHQALEADSSDGVQSAFNLDAAVLNLPLGPVII